MTYTLAQLALIPGMLGIAHLLRARSPRLSNFGGSVAVLGASWYTVHAGGVLVIVSMAQGSADRDALSSALNEYFSSPAGLFSAMSLIVLDERIHHRAGVGHSSHCGILIR